MTTSDSAARPVNAAIVQPLQTNSQQKIRTRNSLLIAGTVSSGHRAPIWSAVACHRFCMPTTPVFESGDKSPHSKFRAPAGEPLVRPHGDCILSGMHSRFFPLVLMLAAL